MLRSLMTIAALATFAAACTTTPAPTPTPENEAPKVTPETAAYDASTPPGAKASWLLEIMNDKGGQVTIEEIEANVDPKMLAALPAPKLQAVLAQVATQAAPFTPKETAQATDTQLVLRTGTKDPAQDMLLIVNVSKDAPHKMDGLLFKPAPRSQAALPTSWEAIDAELAKLGSTASLHVASIDPATGACTPVHTLHPDTSLALGSTFKLYILATLASQIEAGTKTWAQELAVEDKHKSLPSGKMQNDPAGTKHTLKHYAAQMISISDNTATDHLLALVGRDKVEAMVAASGHHAPATMRPFMSTREMFSLKLDQDEAARDAYLKLDEAGKRAELAKITGLPAIAKAATWSKPRHIDTIEWFARGMDLCKLHGQMVVKEKVPAWAGALETMAINDGGVQLPESAWSYVGFKGGSEPGVAHLSYLIKDTKGGWYSIVVGLNDTTKQVPVIPMLDLVRASAMILAR